MTEPMNKFRAAMDVLQKGREVLVEAMAEEILDQGDDLVDGGFQFHEFLESQGTRLHFLALLMSQLEQSADAYDEAAAALAPPPPKPPSRKRGRARAKKAEREMSAEGTPEDL